MDGIILVAGLGNPGRKYRHNRHNAGCWYLDMIAEAHDADFSRQAKFEGSVCRVETEQGGLCLFRSEVFMNESGRSLQAVTEFYKIEPPRILIAHDEIDFPVTKIRLKKSGGHGGHNGLRDVIARIGSDFWRLRIGIGHPGVREPVVRHVLGDALPQEKSSIKEALRHAVAVLPDLAAGNFDAAMNRLHAYSGPLHNSG